MATSPGLPPGRAPTRLTPIAVDQPIGATDDERLVRPTSWFAQLLQRLTAYIGQPVTGNPTGVTVSQQLANLNETAGLAPFASQDPVVEQRLDRIEGAIEQLTGSVPALPPPTLDASFERATLQPSMGGTGNSATPTDGQLPIGNSQTGIFNLATLTAGSGVTITNGHGAVTIAASGTNFISAVDTRFAVSTGTLQFASVASGLMAGNSTAGAAEPDWVTVTSMLDRVFSSTEGAVLYRDAAAWQALGPGVNGQFLGTQGGGLPVQWATPSGAGTGSVLNAFTTAGSHSYTIPAGTNWFLVVLYDAGGGGGAGVGGSAGTNRQAGTGGGAGARAVGCFRATDFSSPITVVVGTHGTGGVAGGAAPTGGGASSFGSWGGLGGGGAGRNATNVDTNTSGGSGGGTLGPGTTGASITTPGGAPGNSNTNQVGGGGGGSTTGGGTPAGSAEHGGGAGGACSNSTGGHDGGSSGDGGGGGGGGQAITSGNALVGGGVGGASLSYTAGGGGAFNSGANGSDGAAGSSVHGGQGGGGGAGNTGGTGFNGGKGAQPGGGGGGGGGGTTTGGNGADGGDGAVYVIAF